MQNTRIVVSSSILFGKPRIKGTRISAEQVLGALAEGWSYKKIIDEFGISKADIIAVIQFAHQSISRTHFVIAPSRKIYV